LLHFIGSFMVDAVYEKYPRLKKMGFKWNHFRTLKYQ
jgi:hypothetical protein